MRVGFTQLGSVNRNTNDTPAPNKAPDGAVSSVAYVKLEVFRYGYLSHGWLEIGGQGSYLPGAVEPKSPPPASGAFAVAPNSPPTVEGAGAGVPPNRFPVAGTGAGAVEPKSPPPAAGAGAGAPNSPPPVKGADAGVPPNRPPVAGAGVDDPVVDPNSPPGA